MTHLEYNNTVRDLLGDDSRPADAFPSDDVPGAFTSSAAAAQVSPLLLDRYFAAAEKLAATAVKNLTTLLPCSTDRNEEACAQSFVEDFGLRAYRRPLDANESQRLVALYRQIRMAGDFASAIAAVTEAMLQSPYFLYRAEPAPAGARAGSVVAVSGYEMASRLSYFLWASMPDRELFAAAKAGRLASVAEVEQQARRMLADARVRQSVTEFFRQWLALASVDSLSKDAKVFPTFTADLRRSMREETGAFVANLMTSGDARVATLLTSSKSFINAPLAGIYGLNMPAANGTLIATELDPGQRAGILTQASLLSITAHALDTSPTRRGLMVRAQLMCQPPPDPPPGVEGMQPPAKPGETPRQSARFRLESAGCRACHTMMDPIGFGFESYDAIGRWRAGDDSGEIIGSVDADGPFTGAPALARRLAKSPQVHACIAEHWFEFAHGRKSEAGDEPALKRSLEAFAASDNDMRALMVALVKSDAFRTRMVEVSQ